MTTPYSTTTTPARFLLLGDCHAIAIGKAANSVGIQFSGGPLGTASEFTTDFFDGSANDVSFRAPRAENLYRKFLDELELDRLNDLEIPLVCTFGFSVHLFAQQENWQVYQEEDGRFPAYFLSSELLAEIIRAMARSALGFYSHARALGLRVVAVTAPQRVPERSNPVIFTAAQDVMSQAVRSMGADVVDLRARTCDLTGQLRPEFCSDESPVHGNRAFGRLVLDELLALGL